MRAALAFVLLAGCGWHAGASPEALYRDGQTLLRRGDMKGARAKAEAGLAREPSWRFRLLKAQVLLTSGEAVEAGRFLASFAAPQDPETRARWRMFQGQADYAQSNFLQSEAAISEAAALAGSLKAPLLAAEIEYHRATLTLLRGDPAGADPIFRRVLRIAAENNDPYLSAKTMGNLGVMYMNASRCDQGIYWLERARDQFLRMGAELSYAKAVGNLGVCYLHLGDYEKAIAYYQEAELGSIKAGNRHDRQFWLGNIATAHLDQGDYAEAAREFREVLGIALETGDKESAAWWLNNLTLASINLGDLDAAERYNQQTVELGLSSWSDYYRRVHEAEIAAARRDFTRAEKLFRAVLALDSADPAPVLDAEAGLAEVLISSSRPDAAESEFRRAMALIERERSQLVREEYKLSYLASLMETYEKYVDFLVTRGQNERALEVAESSRARLLDEKLRARHSSTHAVTAAALKNLARSSDSVLLSYWLAPGRSFVWTVTAAGIDLHILPPEKKISGLVDSYRGFIEALRDPLDSEFPAGRELSAILLAPVREKLAGGARVLLVPDRSLHSLNFETLPDPENPAHYLIDRVTLEVAPSLGLIASAAHPARSDPSILLIGDPDPAVEEYPRLPYAASEIAMIERAVHRAQVFEGAMARPAVYRESHPAAFTWIHFAAHASVNRESPLDSALILSKDAGGYALSAREIMDVPLNASLVTLSACRSAGAKTYSGEGLVGLSWAFLRAGAQNVVAGLWDVTDLSTANLMADFYGALVRGEAPAKALREAKLHMIAGGGAYRKPFYWAPFQLYTGAIAADARR